MSHEQSQCDAILADLKLGRRITPLQAITRYHCMRLAARVSELRDAGYRIKTGRARLANGKVVAEYCLDELVT